MLSQVGQELQCDAVGVAEAHTGAVGRVFDLAVFDAEFVQPERPLLEVSSSGTTEGDMVEADAELAECSKGRRPLVLVQTDERAVADHVDGVVEFRFGVFVDDGFGIEERFVPRGADREFAQREPAGERLPLICSLSWEVDCIRP